MGIFANFNILNQRGTPAMFSDTLANRPAPGFVGRIFIDTDIPTTGIYRDTGTTWELIAGGLQSTPNLQQVTDVGNTTTRNVIIQGRGTYGGANIQTNHRLFVRDVATFTTQYEALSILRDLTYNSSAIFVNGPIYGSIGAADTLNQTANITYPNGVSCSTGVFSTVVLRPAGFDITQNQASGLRALSAYRTQLTIEQSSASNSTISHFAHYFATSIYKLTNSNPVTITNNYGVAISDQTEQTTGLTIINRYAFAQFGTNDRNIFLGRVGIGTSTDAGFQLDVNGTARVQGQITTTTANAQFGNIGAATGQFRIDGVNGPEYAFSVYSSNTLRFGVVGFGGTYGGPSMEVGATFGGANNIQLLSNGILRIIETGNDGHLCVRGLGTLPLISLKGSAGTVHFRTLDNGNTLIGTTNDVASAKLQVVSTTQGFLPPVMTATQRNLINSPANGLIVYDTTFNQAYVYNGTAWLPFVTTKQLNYFVGHASAAAYADNQTYYFGCAPGQPLQTSQGLVRCNVNQTGIITSVYLFIRSAATPSNENINISLYTANGTGVMQIVASTNFAFSGSSPLLCVNWTGLNVVINAGDTFEFQLNIGSMVVNPNNVILSGNVLINY